MRFVEKKCFKFIAFHYYSNIKLYDFLFFFFYVASAGGTTSGTKIVQLLHFRWTHPRQDIQDILVLHKSGWGTHVQAEDHIPRHATAPPRKTGFVY